MGTSKNFSTPKGGPWTPLKNDLTDHLAGDSDITPERLVGRAIAAAGVGLGGLRNSSGGGGTGGGGGRGNARGGGAGTPASRAVGGAVASLAGFGASVRAEGLDAALNRLGLEDLRGRSAAEVLAVIAEKLASDADGPQKEVINAALLEVLFDAADIDGAEGYDDLGASLQSFLDRDGIEGLIESFLTKCVYDGIWFTIEEHVGKKSETNSDVKTLASAIEGVCRAEVRVLMKESRGQGTFEKTDWFGSEGQTAAQVILRELDRRLRALEES
jgi:hypothetical protein